jgi:hypothetical protein
VSGEEQIVESVGVSRRSFVKKLLAIGFAAPVISTFAIEGVAAACAPQGSDQYYRRHQYPGNLFYSNFTI